MKPTPRLIARLAAELDEIDDPDDALSPERIESYISRDLRDAAWELAVARWSALRADSPARARVAGRDCSQAGETLERLGLHAEARRVRAWPESTVRGRSEP